MSANLQSPSQNPPLVNFAPIKPLTDLKRGGRKPDSRIQKAIQEVFQDKHRKNKDVFREINNVGQRIDLMINGKQFLCWNPYADGGGAWGVLPVPAGSSSQRPLNILNNIKQNLLTKWENSNPDIVIRAGRNVSQAQSAAKAADTINNFYERQFYNRYFTQQEALMGMTFGTYIDRYRYDDSKISLTLMQDIFEQKGAKFGDGSGLCGDCGYGDIASKFTQGSAELGQLGGDGPLAAESRCPNCRSTAVKVENPAEEEIFSLNGQREQKHGDLVCELLPLPGCRWDLAVRPEDSTWFMYRREIPKGAITRVLGNVLIPAGNTDSDNGLEVLKALHHQGQPLGGRSGYGNRRSGDDDDRAKGNTLIFDELWLGPDDIAHINLIGDEETVEGDTIPKGKLVDIFPDGLCAVGLNGMSVVLALYPEQHQKHIVSGTWFMRSQTGAGRGLADSVEVQTIFNTMNNQAMDYMTSTYSPAIMYDNQILTGNKMKYIGTPKTNIPVDLTKLPEGRKLAEAIHQMQPTQMPSQFFSFAQNFMSVMAQKTSMVTDFNQGEPGITAQNMTATAAEIDQGNADAINQPIFLIKADCRKRGSEITINLFRGHFPMKRYFDLGGAYGRQQGIELSAADVCADLVFDTVRNSEMPKGPFQKQKNRMQFFAAVGGGAGYSALKQTDPDVIEEMRQEFDVDIQKDDRDAVNELCLQRLDQMQLALKGGVTIPEVLIDAIQPPISAVELELAEKGKWFANWLSTDDGQKAGMPIRAAVELLAKGQIQGAVTQQAEAATQQGTIQAAAMAPATLGQHLLEQNAAQQPESTEPDPTAVLQMQQEQSQQQHEASESAAEHQRELERMDKEHAHEKDETSHDAKEKIKIERSKPRPKPAAKSAGGKK